MMKWFFEKYTSVGIFRIFQTAFLFFQIIYTISSWKAQWPKKWVGGIQMHFKKFFSSIQISLESSLEGI